MITRKLFDISMITRKLFDLTQAKLSIERAIYHINVALGDSDVGNEYITSLEQLANDIDEDIDSILEEEVE